MTTSTFPGALTVIGASGRDVGFRLMVDVWWESNEELRALRSEAEAGIARTASRG